MIIAGLCAAALSAAPMAPADAKAFRGDVDFVTQSIVKMHPAPFAFADRDRFFKDAAAIKSAAAKETLCANRTLLMEGCCSNGQQCN